MSPTQWKSLLTAWSTQLLTTDLIRHLDPADRDLKYLGYPPATATTIKSLESRLEVTLPPSYRNFLSATDGFRVISPFTYRLRPTADVDWFRVEHQGWIETYNEPTIYDNPETAETTGEKYFDYTTPPELDFRRPHLWAMLQISDDGDGVMLLNPLVVTPDGEWEAWFFANWIPGAQRFASFTHMMVETYRSLREIEKLPEKPELPTIKLPSPKTPRHSVVTPLLATEPKGSKLKRKKGQPQLEFIAQFLAEADNEESAPSPPDLIKLLHDLKSTDMKLRAKTIRILRGKLKTRGMSTRYPDLVPLAAELAQSLPDPESRALCVSLLTNITPNGPIPHWLISALNDPHPSVIAAALYAVYDFKDAQLVEPIIKILLSAPDTFIVQRAISALSEIADPRVIPALAASLERDCAFETVPLVARQPHAQLHYISLALALAKFGRSAIPPLANLLHHADPNRRVAGIVALREIGDLNYRSAVEKLKSDPDSNVRQQAELSDRYWGNSPGFQLHSDS